MGIKRHNFLLSVILFFSFTLRAQDQPIVLKTATADIHGSLMLPETRKKPHVVLIIAGSGPTDRNGNQQGRINNSLKQLADSLYAQGIASVRYDKRGLGESEIKGLDESTLRFEQYVQDAKDWISMLAKDRRFSGIVVAGHSEGALIGLIASEDNKHVEGYISIAGAARPADEMIKEQIALQPEEIKAQVYPRLDTLKRGDTLRNVPMLLYTLFRPSVQPYMISWFKYNPQQEIKKLSVPILIIQGTTDIQVQEKDASMLGAANPAATVKMIPNMNHVLKEFGSTNRHQQIATYSNPDLPLNKGLIEAIVPFIKAL